MQKTLPPFKLKDLLVKQAEKSGFPIMDAGRGNPNYLSLSLRKIYQIFESFAYDTQSDGDKDLVFLSLKRDGLKEKFLSYTEKYSSPYARHAFNMIKRAEIEIGENADDILYEVCLNLIASQYPYPPRISPLTERIVKAYLNKTLFQGKFDLSKFSVFGTEGASAAIVYLFKLLKESYLLGNNDKLAILTPVYAPYLEMPALKEYNMPWESILLNKESHFQITDEHLKKLEDKKIKVVFSINPGNPTSVAFSQESLGRLEKFVKEKRPDLIFITDTPYSNMVRGFETIGSRLPKNTIEVYSYSKYQGLAGWRLGVVLIHEDNVMEELTDKLPTHQREAIKMRYTKTEDGKRCPKVIDRLLADSRDTVLTHTAGLSGPQRAMLVIASLYDLYDAKGRYQSTLIDELKRRWDSFYSGLGLDAPVDPNLSHYYAFIDILEIAERVAGKEVKERLEKESYIQAFLVKLAEEKGVICLPSNGFGGTDWEVRISLSNIGLEELKGVGEKIVSVIKGC
ncbi:MAG: bifunctional aspartate transaminase/aspartate 4-decarboxylase [Alphaproteobacteria bacterium]|nr:bifunctional aspartate transaminase/aspartate 4-decarboxylase [Alphaproteobacteria bacterium]